MFLGFATFAVAVAALGVALFGLADNGSGSESAGGGGSGGGAAPSTVEVVLTEFAITPAMIDVAPGDTIKVVNEGTMLHNFSIPDLGLKTPDLNAGESAELVVPTSASGDHDALCEIAGHAGSGMTAMVMIGGGGSSGGGGSTDGGSSGGGANNGMTWQQMDTMMRDVALQFPAKTEGKGGDVMEPTIAADGTKVYDVTAEEVDWEVSPGKIVKAMTYNGVVPAPAIEVQVGDKVRINFTNKLNESTSIHFHGIRVPNSMDGVDPYTQPAVEPGGTFTYEFEAVEPAVGIYHSHHNAQAQVPNGLFGAFLIGEMPVPQKLVDLGYGEITKKVNMVLNDSGTIGLSLNGKSFPATEPYTLKVGEVMEVNYLNEGLMAHPMHMHQPVGWVIAKDGVPLDEPIPGDTINVAPGERYTVLYKATDPGVWAWHCHILNHAEGPEGMFGMVTALIVIQ
jgi:FtsP/CotA-like multicopper oxidase with cupredoxin domain